MDPRSTADPISTALRSLLPAGVACSSMQGGVVLAPLLPEETAAATRFSASRLAEFALGRSCAREALRTLGAAPADIGVGHHREPLWPAGIVGSISHTTSIAVAAVAHADDFAGIGIDIETARALDPGMARLVCRPGELQHASSAGPDEGLAALLIFSAKEAVYKALWPILRRFLDFHDLEIMLDADLCSFRIGSHSPLCPPVLAAAVHGGIALLEDGVAAAAWIPAPAPGSSLFPG